MARGRGFGETQRSWKRRSSVELRGQRRLQDQLFEKDASQARTRELVDERVSASIEPLPDRARAGHRVLRRTRGEEVGGDGGLLGPGADVRYGAAEDTGALGAPDVAGAVRGLGQRREARAARPG